MIVPSNRVAELLIELDRQHRHAIHTMVEAGAAIETIPPLQISMTVVPPDGINAIQRNSVSTSKPTESENIMPDIVNVATRQSKSTQDGTQKSDQASKDLQVTGTTATDEQRQTDQQQTDATEKQTDATEQKVTFGRTDRQTTSISV